MIYIYIYIYIHTRFWRCRQKRSPQAAAADEAEVAATRQLECWAVKLRSRVLGFGSSLP